MSERGPDGPAFVIGTGRCGLSPLMDLVAYHPDFAWPSQLLQRFPRRVWMARLSRVVEWPILRSGAKFSLRPYVPTHDEAWDFWRELYAGFPEPFRDLSADDVTPRVRQRIRRAAEDITRYQKKRRFLAEYSGWSRIGFLREIFPRAQFIHIVRDPRAVVNSLMNVDYWRGYEGTAKWRWGPLSPELEEALEKYDHSFHEVAAVQWKLLIANIMERTSSLPPEDALLVRYEDLVADPRAVAGECVGFLGSDPAHADFERHLPTARIVDANSQTLRIPSWRESMTPRQISMLEELLSDELARFGYV